MSWPSIPMNFQAGRTDDHPGNQVTQHRSQPQPFGNRDHYHRGCEVYHCLKKEGLLHGSVWKKFVQIFDSGQLRRIDAIIYKRIQQLGILLAAGFQRVIFDRISFMHHKRRQIIHPA